MRETATARAICLLVTATLCTLGACQTTAGESCDIGTSEISAVALVVDSGTDLRATIDFELGNRLGMTVPLRLCETDQLTINGQTTVELTKASRTEYTLALPIDGARAFTFTLDRQAVGEVIEFDAALPDAFELTAPMDGDALTLGGDQIVQWEPPLPDATFVVGLEETLGQGPCLETEGNSAIDYFDRGGLQVPDNGQWTIAGADFSATTPARPCDLRVRLTRLSLGDYPTEMRSGGRIEARVERYVDVTTVVAP